MKNDLSPPGTTEMSMAMNSMMMSTYKLWYNHSLKGLIVEWIALKYFV
jgi:hypothetical protein